MMLDMPYYEGDYTKDVLAREAHAENPDWAADHEYHPAGPDEQTGAWSPIEGLLPTVEVTGPIGVFAPHLLSRAERRRLRAVVDRVHESEAGASVSAVALFVFAVLMLVYAPDWRTTLIGVSALLLAWGVWSLHRAARQLQDILAARSSEDGAR